MDFTQSLGEFIRTLLKLFLMFLLMPGAVLLAQENPLSRNTKAIYGGLKGIVLRSAELMPEESYTFKPVDSVRTFGQIVGHVADAQYIFCSIVLGEKPPATKIEQTKSSKADLIASLKEAYAYCDRAYDGMSDATATQPVKFMGSDKTPRLGVLVVNIAHTTEHYGNLVTYMRMKSIVPPTSDPDYMKQLHSALPK